MRLLPLPMDGVKILKKRTLSVAARSASEAIFAFEAFLASDYAWKKCFAQATQS